MGSFSIWHLLILAGIVVLLFGTGRVSDLMGDFAKGIKNFREGLKDHEEEERAAKAKVISSERSEAQATTNEQPKEPAGR